MKAKIGLFLFTMLALAGMGFAGPAEDAAATSYFNLRAQTTGAYMPGSVGTTTLILSQEKTKCAATMWSVCVASEAATPENLAKMLETNWTSKTAKYKGVTLELGTNIDLGEYSATTDEGKCDVNHVPLPTIDSTMFDGKGKSIKNLCYVASAKEPVGLFKTANRVTVKNIKFDGVRIIVCGESTKGESYHPAGALAGVVTFSLIDSISITNASIQGPIAGGLVGYVGNSTLSNVTGDGVVVSNSVAIANGYAGSAELKMETGYNVFLGGLAGVAVRDTSEGDKTFVNDSVRVNVIDEASGHKSALGGIAGYVKTVGNTNENLQVVKGVGAQSEVLLSRISGGSSMGGLFGALTVFKSTKGEPKDNTGKFILRNSKFSGKISEASSLDIMAVGGLVGFDSTESNASFQVVEGYADIDMTDNLKVAGEYQYFAGGIVGYGASCMNGSGTDSDFLSVKNSKTEGIISLSASAAAVDGLHSDAYLGGIVGSACLAQAKDLGIVNDTSSVKITSKVKTAVDKTKEVNGAPARDSVYVGGVIGFASVAVASKAAAITGVYYDGSIMVEDSLNNVFVGGVLGGFTKVEGGKTVKFENVMVRTDNLISYKAKEAGAVTTTNKQETNVGGLCGVCNEITLINKVGVSGGITVSGKHAGNSLMVGGLVGASSANEVAMELRNAFSIGDISVTATHSADDATYEKKVGYLFGKLVLNKGYEIKSVYHYDDVDDTDITVPFGQLGNTESNWAVDENIHYVVRNAEQDTYDAETSGDHNGTVKNVKRSQFAGFLNSAYSKESDYAWSYLKGSNNDLPIFAVKGQYEAVVPEVETYYMVTFVTKDKAETIKQYQVKAGEDSPEPTLEEMEEHPVEGYSFTGEWDKDFHNVQTDLTVEAQYDINVYTVKFFSYDGSQIGKDQSVNYMESAVAPTAPVREGYEFAGWSESYTQVKDDLNIKATYSPKKYLIVFEDYDGSSVGDSIEYDAVVLAPYLNERKATAEYVYTFVGWDPEVTKVKGDAVYKAVYDSTKVLYEVTFLDYDETQIGDVQMVAYGSAAVAPADPVREGYTFAGWNRKFDNVVKNLDVMATYEKIPESSSSVEISSSSEPESSSSAEESSSSVEESSSSVIEVSSSSEPESSSSVEESSSSVEVSSSSFTGKIQIVSPTIEKSGNNAIRLTFGTENVSEFAFARVLVIGGKDTIWIDTLKNSIVGGAQWELVPAPIGKYKVVLIVDDGTRHAETVEYFEVDSEIKATPGSWQMVSLSAFDKKKVKVDDASFYWWDERNPVGDYWQYRAFNGESVDATRGFWYGTTVGNPLVIRESSGSKDSEIVWELDSLYSGWNLVANPYGWNVNLTKGSADNDAKVTFWRWNPVTGYEINPTKLGPYEAVWAKVSKSTTWRMPAAPDFTLEKVPVAETKTVMHKDAAGVKGAWSLKVSLADDYGKQDSWNVIGAGVEETMDEPPAGMGNHVTLAIRNSEKGAKLAKSIKAVANEYSWILDVSANSARDGKLKFEGIKDLNKQGLKLFMTADGVTTEIKNENSVKVALAKSAKQVEVRVAASNAVVASSKIHNFGSTVAGGTLQLGFTAPETLAGANASYAVVGVDGKKVAAGQFKATAGTNQFSLKAPKTGVYFVKVKVGSQQLSSKVLVR